MELADLMVLISTDVEADDVCSTQENGRPGRVHQVFPVSVQVKGPKAPPQPVTSPSGALQQAVIAQNSKLFRSVECDYLTALTVADFKNSKNWEFAGLVAVLQKCPVHTSSFDQIAAACLQLRDLKYRGTRALLISRKHDPQ